MWLTTLYASFWDLGGDPTSQLSESDVAGLIVDIVDDLGPPELICIRSPFVSVAWRISRAWGWTPTRYVSFRVANLCLNVETTLVSGLEWANV
jgi:hypothetical protein